MCAGTDSKMSTFAHYKANKAPLPKVYTLDDIEFAVSDEQAVIRAMSDGFVAFSAGKFNVPPIQTMGAPPLSLFAVSPTGVSISTV